MKTVKSRVSRVDTIPKRKGTRPTTICGPLHIQRGGSGDTKYLRKLIIEVLSWPDVESTPPIVRSPDLISIHLKRGEGAIGSSAATSVREFAKVYLEAATIHVTLPLVAAHWAIVRGWAEPHYLASQGLMPAGTVLLYAPKDESELDVCRFHFSQAYEHARNSGELEASSPFRVPTNPSLLEFRKAAEGHEGSPGAGATAKAAFQTTHWKLIFQAPGTPMNQETASSQCA